MYYLICLPFLESYTQTITDLTAETSSNNSMLVKWSLSESNSYDSEGTFSVYFRFGDYDIFAGRTKDHFFEILGLVSHVKYNVRVELKYPYSGIIISATTHHLLIVTLDTNPTDLGRLEKSDINPTSPSTATEATTCTCKRNMPEN